MLLVFQNSLWGAKSQINSVTEAPDWLTMPASKRDMGYYEILGVTRESNEREIKKA